MPIRQSALFLVMLLPALASAQDSTLNSTVDNFKGLSGQLKEQLPGAASLGKMLGGKQRIDGAVQTEVKISKEQQEYLDKQKMAKERAAIAAKKPRPSARRKPVAAVVAKAAPTPAVAIVPVEPVVDYVNEETLANVKPGLDLEAVLASLGKPRRQTKISGMDEGTQQSLVYYLDPRNKATIRLLDGKVTSVLR